MILVTGGAGYIGSHVVLRLLEDGLSDVVVFDSLENGHIETIQSLQKVGNFAFVKGDLKNSDDIKAVMRKYRIEAVMHFAAYIVVEESVKDPQKYYLNNLVGTLNLLDAMRFYRVNKLVFSSTAAVYGEPQYAPIDENHPKHPINPYGKSKFMVEEILQDYSRAYDLRSVSLRYFNVAGADSGNRIGESHEPETHLIPNILTAAKDPTHVFNLFGDDYDTKDGTCVRDYVNVEDLAEAHVLALQYLLNGGKSDCFNIGTKEGSTVKEVLQVCEQVTTENVKTKVNRRRDGDSESLVADNAKALKILGWHPRKTLHDSVTTAYNWLRKKS